MNQELITHKMLTDPEVLIKPGQLRRIHMLLGRLGLNDNETRADICSAFSARGFTSSRQLLDEEAARMIEHLESKTEEDSLQLMRRALLSQGYRLGWHRNARKNCDLSGRHPSVINKHNVNEWCMSHRCKVRKPMEEMDKNELRITLSQLKLITKKETGG